MTTIARATDPLDANITYQKDPKGRPGIWTLTQFLLKITAS